MKYNKTLALVPAILLAACGGEEQAMKPTTTPGSMVYSYPMDGQKSVSPKTDLVLRFSHAVTDRTDDLASKIKLTSGETEIPVSVEKIDDGKSLKLVIDGELPAGAPYSVSFSEPLVAEGGRSISTPNAVGEPGIQFDTRGSFSGIADLANTSGQFDVAWQVPASNGPFQAMNFSTFRIAMTQPVHPDWKALGGTIQLLDPEGQAVPATVLVKGNRVTVDPCVTDDPLECGGKQDTLESGQTYTLKLENLASLTNGPEGERFSNEFTFTPRDTGPTVVLQQSAIDSGLAAGLDEDNAIKSVLNGQPINGVTLNSVLQGKAGPSQQTGDLFAELAYAPSFDADEAIPLRIAKGSVLKSTSLDVLVGGKVPVLDAATGQLQTTGDIKVTMISDASGYMSPNPYTDDLNAPRHITLFMDVSMNTEEAQPNASLSQDLMGVELRGIALVKDGVLTIDAIGMVEPNLLGQEYTDSTIAFHLEAATDVDSALDAETLREMDTTPPQLVSWMPGPDDAIPETRQSMQRPGDPVVLNFDEPIDPDTIASGLTLDNGSGTALTIADGTLEAFVDGTAVVVNPVGGLEHGVDYSLNISNALSDLAGNPAMDQSLTFSLPELAQGSEVTVRSPFALTTYPGFPCVTENLDLADGSHGTCVDNAPTELSETLERDQLPVTALPEDRPIVVKFSQSMDLSTINSQTFVVEKIADPASPTEAGTETAVPGRFELNNQQVRFYPEMPWSEGETYRYTLRSASNGDCTSGNYICSAQGFPLDTDLLMGQDADRDGNIEYGGPDMEIYFTGAASVSSVFTPLRNLPVRDTNSNYEVDCGTLGGINCPEPFAHEPDDQDGFKPSANASKLLVTGKTATVLGAPAGAAVGCEASASCPKNKFIYQTYGLDTEVIGPAKNDAGETIGVRVLLYPTLLMTTNASVFLDGLGEQRTGPQILRMTYGEPTEDNPLGLVEGVIVEGPDGRPTFITTADLTLDAPDLTVPLEGTLRHNLYSYPFSLELEGPITFFDDGRMQIEQRNTNNPALNVLVTTDNALLDAGVDLLTCVVSLFSDCGGLLDQTSTDTGAVKIPLQIPDQGVYLNFISNPIKEIPAQQ